MSAMQGAGLERLALVAADIVEPVAEVVRQLTGARVSLETAEAARADPRDLAESLEGWYWAIPVELTGVHNGAASVLLSQELVAADDDEEAANFASMIDEHFARAGEKLHASWGGPVSLDRVGLRRTQAESASKVVLEALGPGELAAVRFDARSAEAERDELVGEVVVVFGGRLVSELVGSATARIPAPGSPRSAADLMRRARSLRVRVSADVGGKTMTLGELAALEPGSVIDLAKNVVEPIELLVQGQRVAYGDAVTLPRGFGFRVRHLGRGSPPPAVRPNGEAQ